MISRTVSARGMRLRRNHWSRKNSPIHAGWEIAKTTCPLVRPSDETELGRVSRETFGWRGCDHLWLDSGPLGRALGADSYRLKSRNSPPLVRGALGKELLDSGTFDVVCPVSPYLRRNAFAGSSCALLSKIIDNRHKSGGPTGALGL